MGVVPYCGREMVAMAASRFDWLGHYDEQDLLDCVTEEELIELAEAIGEPLERLVEARALIEKERRGRAKGAETGFVFLEQFGASSGMELLADFQEAFAGVEGGGTIRAKALWLLDYGLTVAQAAQWLGCRYQQVYNAKVWREKKDGKTKGTARLVRVVRPRLRQPH
jgi:hypothetical protein